MAMAVRAGSIGNGALLMYCSLYGGWDHTRHDVDGTDITHHPLNLGVADDVGDGGRREGGGDGTAFGVRSQRRTTGHGAAVLDRRQLVTDGVDDGARISRDVGTDAEQRCSCTYGLDGHAIGAAMGKDAAFRDRATGAVGVG